MVSKESKTDAAADDQLDVSLSIAFDFDLIDLLDVEPALAGTGRQTGHRGRFAGFGKRVAVPHGHVRRAQAGECLMAIQGALGRLIREVRVDLPFRFFAWGANPELEGLKRVFFEDFQEVPSFYVSYHRRGGQRGLEFEAKLGVPLVGEKVKHPQGLPHKYIVEGLKNLWPQIRGFFKT